MAKSAARSDPLKEAFLATATGLAEAEPRSKPAALARMATLAMLRRALLESLPTSGGLGERWEWAAARGCPLLDPALEPGGPGTAERASLPAPAPDPGALYLGLQDFQLARRGKPTRWSVRTRRTARRRSGAFYTPTWMAERLAHMALEPLLGVRSLSALCALRLLDPACGDGRLLLACLDVLLDTAGVEPGDRPAAVRRLVAGTIRGVDSDPVAAALARSALWLACDPDAGPIEGLEQAIVVGDALDGPLGKGRRAKAAVNWTRSFPDQCAEGSVGFDVVVANPPFEVLTGFARRRGLKQYVARIRASGYELALSGSLNTYRLFLERSLSLLAEGGRLAFVLPFGFLMDRTASALRAHMLKRGWVERVEVYPESSRAFEQVGQSIALLAACRRDNPNRAVEVVDGTGRAAPHRVQLSQIAELSGDSLSLPIVPGEALALAARMRALNGRSLGDLAEGRVGELDQTQYRDCMRSKKSEVLLVRGAHLSAFRVDLEPKNKQERWVDWERFVDQRGKGAWRQDMQAARLAQTGIVNMEAARRLVAGVVPAGVVLGNSVNYWVARPDAALPEADARAYLLGLLNSTPLEWRFRLTSSNNNINLYEVRSLPLPCLAGLFPAERIDAYLARIDELIRTSGSSPLGLVRQITAGWGAPGRDDRVAAMLIGRVAEQLAGDGQPDPRRREWLEHVLDHLVNWHLGLDEPDLERMLEDVPARAWKEHS